MTALSLVLKTRHTLPRGPPGARIQSTRDARGRPQGFYSAAASNAPAGRSQRNAPMRSPSPGPTQGDGDVAGADGGAKEGFESGRKPGRTAHRSKAPACHPIEGDSREFATGRAGESGLGLEGSIGRVAATVELVEDQARSSINRDPFLPGLEEAEANPNGLSGAGSNPTTSEARNYRGDVKANTPLFSGLPRPVKRRLVDPSERPPSDRPADSQRDTLLAPRCRGRPPPPPERDAPGPSGAEEATEGATVAASNWVQCESCNKWRELPPDHQARV